MASNPTNHLLSEASERPCTQPLPLHNPHAWSNNHGPDHVDDSKPRPSADKAKVRRVVSAAQCRSTCKVSPRFSHEYDVRVSTTTACRYALIKYLSDKASKSEVLNARVHYRTLCVLYVLPASALISALPYHHLPFPRFPCARHPMHAPSPLETA